MKTQFSSAFAPENRFWKPVVVLPCFHVRQCWLSTTDTDFLPSKLEPLGVSCDEWFLVQLFDPTSVSGHSMVTLERKKIRCPQLEKEKTENGKSSSERNIPGYDWS